MTTDLTAARPLSRGRIVGARILAWLFALVAALPLFGIVDLGTVFGLSDPQYLWSMSLEASWGSLLTFFVAAGFGWVGVLPARPWPGLGLLVLASGSLAIAGAVFADAGPLWLALGIAACAAALCLVVPPGHPPLRFRAPSSARSVVLLLGVPLWLGYGWNTWVAAHTGTMDGDVTMGVDHWPVQVALGLALAVGSALLAGLNTGLVLWRWAFALSAGFVAYAALVFPTRGGAMPHPGWGAAFALWAVAVAALPTARPGTKDALG